ncbi:MAG: pyridoxal 5'-phosphate synthase glutaminase subunit PdxT [Deltaproteobacteria bacterium]|nr:pyridoxal 5'-phosphate synthase glutaminase subunit PdxT [Deltaproteobacteria bacterium]
MKIGVLALQGAVQPHKEKLIKLGVEVEEVRHPSDLKKLSGIILPGGESTTLVHLIRLNGLWDALHEFVSTKPSWGVCAGAILLANQVRDPEQPSLGSVNIMIRRNAYGRQVDSFIRSLTPTAFWKNKERIEGVFIRAPKIVELAPGVVPLFMDEGDVVLAEQNNCLVSTFHPELTDNLIIHEYFLSKCHESSNP